MEKKEQKYRRLRNIAIVAIVIVLIAIVINLAPNFVKDFNTGKMTVIVNNKDITEKMKYNPFVGENEVVYVSTKDIARYFDDNIFYDNVYKQILTSSETKFAALPLDANEMYVNSSKVDLNGSAREKDNQFYLPFSEMNDVYNLDVKYYKETNTLVVDSLDKEQKKGNASKDISIKYKPTIFSKNVDDVKQGKSMVIIAKRDDGWYKVRTDKGVIGYTKDVANVYTSRENMEEKKQVDGTVSLIWDYYTRTVPDRTGTTLEGINVISPAFIEVEKLGKGELVDKIGTSGQRYIDWAHQNGYKVWAMVSNNSYPETTTEILNDYKLRENLINNIVNMTLQYNLDGINLDFEYVQKSNKDVYTRLIIELAPRLKDIGKVLSVDVTAPDGSADWSECYDRNAIGKVVDYVVFMAYDQYGTSSTKAGTTAGADWVEVAIEKFINREEVPAEKIILGMPFYTRVWKESDELSSDVIYMRSVDKNIPAGVEKEWKDDVKQYYIEYEKNGATYKMWIEDENSINAKFDLMDKYKLAGAAYWQIDFEKDTIWDVLKERTKIK